MFGPPLLDAVPEDAEDVRERRHAEQRAAGDGPSSGRIGNASQSSGIAS